MIYVRSGWPICAPSHLSEVYQTLPLNLSQLRAQRQFPNIVVHLSSQQFVRPTALASNAQVNLCAVKSAQVSYYHVVTCTETIEPHVDEHHFSEHISKCNFNQYYDYKNSHNVFNTKATVAYNTFSVFKRNAWCNQNQNLPYCKRTPVFSLSDHANITVSRKSKKLGNQQNI